MLFRSGVALVALALAIPIGLLAALGIVVTRRGVRRQRERALDAI